jgi:type I restriction enzyme S subunit
LRVNNLRKGRIATDSVLHVSQDIERKYARTRLRGGEVVVSLVGSVGEVAVVPEKLGGWNVARAVAVIRPSDEVSAEWLKYCLSSSWVRRHMHMWQTDTVQATLNLRDVRRLPIVLPPRPERDAIEGVLSALDDTIENSHQVTKRCRQLSLALFDQALSANEQHAKVDEVAEFHNRRRSRYPVVNAQRDKGSIDITELRESSITSMISFSMAPMYLLAKMEPSQPTTFIPWSSTYGVSSG